MSVKIVSYEDKNKFDSLALHPLQSWAWGDFRKKTGIEVIRLGIYERGRLIETAQVTIHPIPFTSRAIGYLPKGNIPSQEMLNALFDAGNKYKCIFIKLEPNIQAGNNLQFLIPKSKFLIPNSPHPLFTKYTFQLDLTVPEETLLKNMHPKTRYNIKIAQKHRVTVREDNSDRAFASYLKLTFETTKRQKFFAHDRQYHQLMWETLRDAKITHLLTATLENDGTEQILVTWILFLFNNILYYPYGASSNLYRNLMPSNLIMWEAIRFGKKHGAKIFDMWGALGPNPDPLDPWYGFHKFKLGFGAQLIEFVGSFDLVIEPKLYRLYNFIHQGREIFLKIKARFK